MQSSTVVLIDGGLSTALESLGSDLSTSLWSADLLRNKQNQNQIRAAHQLYIDAGAEIIISSSYQLSYQGAHIVGWSKEEIYQALFLSTELARFDNKSVAASIGPYGAYLADGSEYKGNYGLSKDELKDFHRERLYTLIGSKPDYLAIETIPELTEASAILELLREYKSSDVDIPPFWVSFSCKNETDISSGEKFIDAVALVKSYNIDNSNSNSNSKNNGGKAFAVGINCTPPQFVTHLLQTVKTNSSSNTLQKLPFIVYPNSGREWDPVEKKWLEGDEFAGLKSGFTRDLMQEWIANGACLIGGCCSVGPESIANMKVRLENRE